MTGLFVRLCLFAFLISVSGRPYDLDASTDSVAVVLYGNMMEVITAQYKISLDQNELDGLWSQLQTVNGTIPGLYDAYVNALNTVTADRARVAADIVAVSNAQQAVANSQTLVGQTRQRLTNAQANLQYAQLQDQAAEAAYADYSQTMTPVEDKTTQAAIMVINQISCTTANQQDMCNVDPEGVLAFWAQNGCRINSGFICSAPQGFCICPVSSSQSQLDDLPPNTPKNNAVWSAGTMRSVLQDIQGELAGFGQALQDANAALQAAQAEYAAASTAYSNAVFQLNSNIDLLNSLQRQLAQDQATLEADAAILGGAQEKYESAVQLRDLLLARYTMIYPILSKTIAKLQRDINALVAASSAQVTTIDCTTDAQCQDGNGGSLTFFANLACHTTGFVCDTVLTSCGCSTTS